MSSSSKILFIFTGSIATYKAVALVSRLVQRGYDVECVLTQSASKFIGRATIEGLTGKAVHTDLFDSDNIMSHIHLIRDASAVVVAPATANFINKIANGFADDLASTLFLAHDFKKPFIVAPAMNTKMYEHPQTQASIKRLKETGVTILEAGSGILACGEVGYGKLLEPEIMIVEIEKILKQTPPTPTVPAKKPNLPRILITGGGTVEKIDDVRSLTNSSSGETAISLARYFYDLGLPTSLIINNQKDLPLPNNMDITSFSSFADLNSALKDKLGKENFDFVIHAAAVSDFSLAKIEGIGFKKSPRKISSAKSIKLVLKPNFKIISKIAQYSKNKKVKVIGFKLTSHADQKIVKQAVDKVFAHKGVHYVVQNDVTKIDRQKGIHHFSLFEKNVSVPLEIESREHLLALLAQTVIKELK
ncbi:MAG: bifunctional phosphopantothenoylcysteine decarboxylase/phosphopantothenate--cysteine ligase CoaBC [Bdellovibrionaceae bacterium]|nr:bifunctional phosphopantothenoylcysteine decarboxylase/phosphopantothenate--cysteine ligase CoaBC [Pseudobdellovibrionaceae bacterium]